MGKGGKGGFGALLRHAARRIGAKKNKNYGSMRDLYGRRIRQVDAEQKIAEWTQLKKQQLIERREGKKKHKEERITELQARIAATTRKTMEESREVRSRIGDAVMDVLKNNPTAILESARTSIAAGTGVSGSRKRRRDPELAENIDDLFNKIIAGEVRELDDYLSSDESDEDEALAMCDAVLEELQTVLEKEDELLVDEETEEEEEEEEHREIVLEDLATIEDLRSISDLDSLKSELMRRGMKCGGRLEDRLTRLWSVRGLDAQDYPKSVLKKG